MEKISKTDVIQWMVENNWNTPSNMRAAAHRKKTLLDKGFLNKEIERVTEDVYAGYDEDDIFRVVYDPGDMIGDTKAYTVTYYREKHPWM